jgi:hypothetical protein
MRCVITFHCIQCCDIELKLFLDDVPRLVADFSHYDFFVYAFPVVYSLDISVLDTVVAD